MRIDIDRDDCKRKPKSVGVDFAAARVVGQIAAADFSTI